MDEVKLAPGWLCRDVNKAVEERKCHRILCALDTGELRQWAALGVALLRARSSKERPATSGAGARA